MVNAATGSTSLPTTPVQNAPTSAPPQPVTATVAPAALPEIVATTLEDQHRVPANLLKKVLNDRGYDLPDLVEGYPKALSPSEVQDPTKTSEPKVEFYTAGGKEFATLSLIYDVVVQRPGSEPVHLQIQHDIPTKIRKPTVWGGAEAKSFHAAVEAAFAFYKQEMDLVGKCARNYRGVHSGTPKIAKFIAFLVRPQQAQETQEALNYMLMRRPGIHLGTQAPGRTAQSLLGHRVKHLPTGTPLFMTGYRQDLRTAQPENPIQYAPVFDPIANRYITPRYRSDTTLVLPDDLQEQMNLLNRVKTGRKHLDDADIDPADRDFVIETLHEEATMYKNNLYGLADDPLDTLEFYHPDMTPDHIEWEREKARAAEERIELIKGRHSLRDDGEPIFKETDPDRHLYFYDKQHVQAFELMKVRARGTLEILEESHEGLTHDSALLADQATEFNKRLARTGPQLEAFKQLVDDLFPPKLQQATVAPLPAQPQSATVAPATAPQSATVAPAAPPLSATVAPATAPQSATVAPAEPPQSATVAPQPDLAQIEIANLATAAAYAALSGQQPPVSATVEPSSQQSATLDVTQDEQLPDDSEFQWTQGHNVDDATTTTTTIDIPH